jgi:hypothetical protein
MRREGESDGMARININSIRQSSLDLIDINREKSEESATHDDNGDA